VYRLETSFELYFLVAVNLIFWLAFSLIVIKRTYLALAVAPLLISMALRVQSVFYIDLFGPVYSSQLFIALGPGTNSIYMIICYTAFFIPFLLVLEFFVFRYPKKLSVRTSTNTRNYIENCFYLFLIIFFLALYIQLFIGGIIPLIDHIERFDFANNHAGNLHDYLFKYGTIFAIVLGGQTVYSKLTMGYYDRRAFIFFFLMLFYALLTGHRFAAFNKFTSFYVIPFSLVFARNFHIKRQKLSQDDNKQGWIIFAVIIISFSIALFSIVNSYSNVRTVSNESVIVRILERLLIQQGELWIETANRVRGNKSESLTRVIDYLFFNPIISGKNSTIQYLMWLSLGSEAVRILDLGQQYAGGFPEIFVEVFGLYMLLPALIFYAMIMSMVSVVFMTSLRKGKLLSMIMAAFIMYAFVLTTYNGMLNQYFVLTFWVKVLLLMIVFICPSIQLPKLRLFGVRPRRDGIK